MKDLKELNLLDRFLFAEAMEDPENMRDVLEIIFGKNTKNLPKRSRFYQSMIDSKLLEPGEKDFNKMNDVYIILIAPFDLFGEGKYMYTFQMTCQESFSVLLNDGATRIFLNTHGTNPEDVSPELVELLHYIENTTQEVADSCTSPRIHKMQERICSIKSSEEVSVKYMQRWEEMEMEKDKARAEGRNSIAKLMDKLLEENRVDDCKRAVKDPEFCQKLMDEFGIE
ncbi:Rpn family recombination-promoting nuclease/putative transposase [Blautia sp. Sow4_E7]|uniref:Rpn family recombination-promoting nuclease/putative transposase n=1 Tax=Blautia sp. Sow4_E7 TaxID=3438749 RepID=UPI003F936D57